MKLLLWCIYDWRSSVRFTVGPQTGIVVFCKHITLIHKYGGFSCFEYFWTHLLNAFVSVLKACTYLQFLDFIITTSYMIKPCRSSRWKKSQQPICSAITDHWQCLCFSQGPNPRALQYLLSSTNTYLTTAGFCQPVQLKKSLTLEQSNPGSWALMSTSEKMKKTKDHVGLSKKGRMVLQGELGVLALAIHARTIEHCRNYLATAVERGDSYSALKRSEKCLWQEKKEVYTLSNIIHLSPTQKGSMVAEDQVRLLAFIFRDSKIYHIN